MNLTAHHPKISSIVLPFLQGAKAKVLPNNEDNVVLDESLTDYGGTRLRIKVHLVDDSHVISLHVSLFGWDAVQADAIPALRSAFGEEAVSAEQEVCDGFHFVVKVDSSKLPTGETVESCADLLSQVRVLAVGAPLRAAFDSLASDGAPNSGADGGDPIVLPMYKPTPNGQKSTCYLASYPERVTVVFNVDFEDETDRALARLFLQHFVEAQRKSANNAPICDFRRGNDPPREILGAYRKGPRDTSGFLSFTFLSSNVSTQEKRERAVRLIVVFLPYIDGHVKASKAHMNMKIHKTKADLLAGLTGKAAS